ncbi:hypothetical protein O181_126000, partial [Austropuccinia psidii MF-1]|nr:hypothetical protein [Austropuccinia psidii MF-1]
MLANKYTRNVCLLSAPSDHKARGVLAQDALARTPLWSTMMKRYMCTNGHRDLKQANANDSRQSALSPQASICPPPLLGHHLIVTSFLDLSKVIIRPMKDGDGKRTFKLGLIVTMSSHRWDSNAKVKQNSPNPPRRDSPVPRLPCEQTLRQPTPGLSGTRWSEELFHEPSRTKEPPIPGRSPSSQPPEDDTTCGPEPEVAPTQSTEEPFGKSQFHFSNSTQLFLTPPSTISILSHHPPLNHYHRRYA